MWTTVLNWIKNIKAGGYQNLIHILWWLWVTTDLKPVLRWWHGFQRFHLLFTVHWACQFHCSAFILVKSALLAYFSLFLSLACLHGKMNISNEWYGETTPWIVNKSLYHWTWFYPASTSHKILLLFLTGFVLGEAVPCLHLCSILITLDPVHSSEFSIQWAILYGSHMHDFSPSGITMATTGPAQLPW